MSFSRAGFAAFQFADAGPYDATSRRAALDRLDMLATVFDTAFILPGTKMRFGVRIAPSSGARCRRRDRLHAVVLFAL